MSSSIALRRSPKPGAFTARDVERAAELVHDERRERLALDVLGDDEERLARARDLLEQREQVLHVEIFFSWMRMYASSRIASIRSGSVTKYGER